MFNFMSMRDNYDDRKLGRDTSRSGIQVSTCWTDDEGYETALIDSEETTPVERYTSKEDAESGHAKWLEFAHDAAGEEVTKLGGWNGLVEDEKVTLLVKKGTPNEAQIEKNQ